MVEALKGKERRRDSGGGGGAAGGRQVARLRRWWGRCAGLKPGAGSQRDGTQL